MLIVIITRISIGLTTISVKGLLLNMCMYLADDSYYLIAVCTETISLLCFEKLQVLYYMYKWM